MKKLKLSEMLKDISLLESDENILNYCLDKDVDTIINDLSGNNVEYELDEFIKFLPQLLDYYYGIELLKKIANEG